MSEETARDRLAASWEALADDLLTRLGKIHHKNGVKSVKKTRKAVRRMRFVLDRWGGAVEGTKPKKLAKRLRKLSKALGPARDAAVHVGCVQRAAADAEQHASKKIARAGAALVERLDARRRGLTWRVLDRADKECEDKDLAERVRALRWVGRDGLEEPALPYSSRLIHAEVHAVVDAAWVLEGEDDVEARHELRKIGRAPVTLDFLFGDPDRPGIEAIKTLRTQLGDLHDFEDTRERLLQMRAEEIDAAGKVDAYQEVSAKHLDRFFDHALAYFDREHAALLAETRASWPALQRELTERFALAGA